MHLNNTLNNTHFEKDKLASVFCVVPFTAFHIYQDGQVSNCCITWLPKTLGNIVDTSIFEIMQLNETHAVQKSVADGTFKFCDLKLCPRLSTLLALGQLEYPLLPNTPVARSLYERQSTRPPIAIYLDYDRSCNLHCPSCRNETILFSKDTASPDLLRIHEGAIKSIAELLDKGFKVDVNVTGSGDPFASPLFWSYLTNLEYHKNLTVSLHTNGVLMNEDRLLPHIRRMLRWVNVSVDAATEETYNVVRRGGNFNLVRRNIEFFDQMIIAGDFPILEGWRVNFVVQKENYQEIVPFAVWALALKSLSEIWYNLIADWGHLSSEVFSEKAIWRKEHALHTDFAQRLKDPILRSSPRINLGNMSHFV